MQTYGAVAPQVCGNAAVVNAPRSWDTTGPIAVRTVLRVDGDGAEQRPFIAAVSSVLEAAVVTVSLVLLVVLSVVIWRISRRYRAGRPARVRVERGLLRARAATLPPGPRRRVARLRVRM